MSDPYTWPESFRSAWDAAMRACGLDPDARVPFDPADNEYRDAAAEQRKEERGMGDATDAGFLDDSRAADDYFDRGAL